VVAASSEPVLAAHADGDGCGVIGMPVAPASIRSGATHLQGSWTAQKLRPRRPPSRRRISGRGRSSGSRQAKRRLISRDLIASIQRRSGGSNRALSSAARAPSRQYVVGRNRFIAPPAPRQIRRALELARPVLPKQADPTRGAIE
jgi:hypothetical protein